MKKIMVLDNYDSFTYNLVHALKKITGRNVDVFRNDQLPLEKVMEYDKIVLSPGPGIPDEAGVLKDLIAAYASSKSILGVCLGLQAIGEVYGAKLINLRNVYHGVATSMHILTPDEILFKGIPDGFQGGRYHSWIVSRDNLPSCFDITVEDDQGEIMGLTHKEYDLRAVQFHPESVLTPLGEKMIENWLNS
jgi:anthranilate synthase component 2